MAGPLCETKRKLQNEARKQTMENDFASDRIAALWKMMKAIVKNEELYPTSFYQAFNGFNLKSEKIIVEHGVFKITIEFEKK